MFVVDTNVLIYAADSDSPEHEPCRAQLEGWRVQATPWYLTWGIVYEFLRVATHPQVLKKPWSAATAWSFLAAAMASPAQRMLVETERHRSVMEDLIRTVPHLSGNLLHDAHIAALMTEHGIKTIVTRDTDFHRFASLNVVDPLQTG